MGGKEMNRKKVQGICVVCLHSWCLFVLRRVFLMEMVFMGCC